LLGAADGGSGNYYLYPHLQDVALTPENITYFPLILSERKCQLFFNKGTDENGNRIPERILHTNRFVIRQYFLLSLIQSPGLHMVIHIISVLDCGGQIRTKLGFREILFPIRRKPKLDI